MPIPKTIKIAGTEWDIYKSVLTALLAFVLWWAKGYYTDTQKTLTDLDTRLDKIEKRSLVYRQILIDHGWYKSVSDEEKKAPQ